MSSILYWVVLVAFMLGAWYFLMMRPQRKKMKEHEAMMSNLKPGARVITVAGIYGEIDSVGESTLVLKLEDGARMKVSKTSIAGLEEVEGAEEEEAEEEAEETEDEDKPSPG
jgi:preprotein translocase subunit YajC